MKQLGLIYRVISSVVRDYRMAKGNYTPTASVPLDNN